MKALVLQERLDELAREAVRRYPYYRERCGAVMAGGSLSDSFVGGDRGFGFEDLPYVDKAIINGNRSAFESDDGPLLISFTSGSTGTPFRCSRTRQEQLALSAAIQRCRLRQGLPVGFRLLLLGNSLSAEPRMAAFYADQAQRSDPHLLQGRCSGLLELALHYERNRLSPPPSLRFTQNWGEYPQPAQRKVIERVFGVPMLDYYGMEEIWMIAFSNASGELEIDESQVFVETLDPRTGLPLPEGEMGELAVTSFVARSLPFLRYRTGDTGRVVRSRGERGPVLELLPFRQSQIRLPGRTVNASVLRYLDRFYRSLAEELDIRQFQLVQERETAFKLLAVADREREGELKASADRLARLLKQCLLLDELEVKVERTDAIAPHPVSGKFQPFVSLVSESQLSGSQ